MPDPEPDQESAPKIEISERDVREAARLLRVFAGAINHVSYASNDDAARSTRHELVLRARIILNSRKLRGQHFNRSMFGEPAWDILLELYANDGKQTIGRLAEWIEAPLTTATRWIDYLARERLVEREPHPNDKRVMYIKLLEKGRQLLDEYLRRTPWDPDSASV